MAGFYSFNQIYFVCLHYGNPFQNYTAGCFNIYNVLGILSLYVHMQGDGRSVVGHYNGLFEKGVGKFRRVLLQYPQDEGCG